MLEAEETEAGGNEAIAPCIHGVTTHETHDECGWLAGLLAELVGGGVEGWRAGGLVPRPTYCPTIPTIPTTPIMPTWRAGLGSGLGY